MSFWGGYPKEWEGGKKEGETGKEEKSIGVCIIKCGFNFWDLRISEEHTEFLLRLCPEGQEASAFVHQHRAQTPYLIKPSISWTGTIYKSPWNKWATWQEYMLHDGSPHEPLTALEIEIWGATFNLFGIKKKFSFDMNLHQFEGTFTNNVMEINLFCLLSQCWHKKQESDRNERWYSERLWGENTRASSTQQVSLRPRELTGVPPGDLGVLWLPCNWGTVFIWEETFYSSHMMRIFFIRKGVRCICIIRANWPVRTSGLECCV